MQEKGCQEVGITTLVTIDNKSLNTNYSITTTSYSKHLISKILK